MIRKKERKKVNIVILLLEVFIFLYLFVLVIPFLWGIITSLKDSLDLRYNMFGLPTTWMWENYVNVFHNLSVTFRGATYVQTFYMERLLLNSLCYSVVSALTITLVTYIVAYARNIYDYKILRVLDVIVLLTMALPIVGALPSQIHFMRKFGLYQNFFGITLIAKFGFLNMFYFVIGAALRGIPKAYLDSARIDGANEFQILIKVILPLSISIVATVYIIEFIAQWNDYQTPFIFLKNFPTAAYGLWAFNHSSQQAGTLTVKLAATFLIVSPVLIIFIIFHKKLMGGISLSEGVKE